MSMSRFPLRNSRSCAMGAVLLAGLALGGCSSGPLAGLGGGAQPVEAQPEARAISGAEIARARAAARCPRIDIQSGTETLTVGGQSGPRSVRYQASISDTARECSAGGEQGNVNLGVSGRLVLGPAGAPGTYTIPVRLVVTRGLREPVVSELRRVSVTVPAGQTSASFSLVDTVAFPMQAGDVMSSYRILVGFDERGG